MKQHVWEGRFTAEVGEEFVVFIIGMRINKLLSFKKWISVFNAMGPMIKELYQLKEHGFLHTEVMFNWRRITLLQYWKSFEHLEKYAHGQTHATAWKEFNKKIGSDGTVGIFHETYKIKANSAEAVYRNMPKFGLSSAFKHVELPTSKNSARQRFTMGEKK
jgi:heme-degrading monooxygenase HmoA